MIMMNVCVMVQAHGREQPVVPPPRTARMPMVCTRKRVVNPLTVLGLMPPVVPPPRTARIFKARSRKRVVKPPTVHGKTINAHSTVRNSIPQHAAALIKEPRTRITLSVACLRMLYRGIVVHIAMVLWQGGGVALASLYKRDNPLLYLRLINSEFLSSSGSF